MPKRPFQPLQGFDEAEALHRLLLRLDREPMQARLREQLETRPAPEGFVSILAEHGHTARVAQVERAGLASLDLPTLLQLSDRSWILLLGRSRKSGILPGWEVEGASGHHHIPARELPLSGLALDLLPELPEEGSLWGRVGRLLVAHRRILAQMVLVSALVQLLFLALPFLTRMVMDRALPEQSASLLGLAVLGLVLANLGLGALELLRDWTGLYLEHRLDAIVQRGLLDHTLRLPFQSLFGRTVGDLVQAFQGLARAKDLLGHHLFGVLLSGLMSLAYLGLMLSFWPMGTGLALFAALLIGLISLAVGGLQARLQRASVNAEVRERDVLVQSLRGIETVKALGAEERLFERWSFRYGQVLELSRRIQRLDLWEDTLLGGLRQLLTLGLLLTGGRLALRGEMSLGTLFAFLQMAAGLMGAFQSFAGLASQFLGARPQLQKARELLEHTPERLPRAWAGAPSPALQVKGLSFRYGPQEPWILKDLDLKVEPGGTCWLRWPSGAGKSTLLRLLAGLLEPGEGSITIGGLPARDARSQVVYLPQYAQLYASSLLENLRILSGQAPTARLLAAAHESGLAELAADLPMGLETVLSQGGTNLSGGQRQLVLLTAAMATERRLLLLDEAFSNLDWVTRSALLKSPWFEGKTLLYASHDAPMGVG